jgi:hypothetical protein
MKKVIVSLFVAAGLAACSETAAELAQRDDAICQGYGLEKGSPQYVQCREFQQADRTTRYQAYQQRQAIWDVANAISKIGQKNN